MIAPMLASQLSQDETVCFTDKQQRFNCVIAFGRLSALLFNILFTLYEQLARLLRVT